jgi:hypothetical protein
MSLLERLLENCLGDDLTESVLWTDGVFRALEQDQPGEHGIEAETAATDPPPEML